MVTTQHPHSGSGSGLVLDPTFKPVPIAQVLVDAGISGGEGQGPMGPPGAAATVNVIGTNTLSPGSTASVAQGGTSQNRTLTFNIPQGQSGTDSAIPTLMIARGSREFAAPGWTRIRLRLVAGSVQPGDQVFLLRYSYSGRGRSSPRTETYQHRDHGWQVTRIGYSNHATRAGFRHPEQPPNWGAFSTYVWTPAFYNGGMANAPGVQMDVRIPFQEMMRHKPLHRRRGKEILKFVVARPSLGRPPYQYGDCLNTLVVRLHGKGAPGSLDRRVSITVRA